MTKLGKIAVFLLYMHVYCVRRSHLASAVKHFLLHLQLSAFFHQHCHGHKFQTPKYNCHICCRESDLVEKTCNSTKINKLYNQLVHVVSFVSVFCWRETTIKNSTLRVFQAQLNLNHAILWQVNIQKTCMQPHDLYFPDQYVLKDLRRVFLEEYSVK